MHDLGKKDKHKIFQFDLEMELHKHPEEKMKMHKLVENREHEIKTVLKKGLSHDHLEQYNTLLHGYHAFKRVVDRITRSK